MKLLNYTGLTKVVNKLKSTFALKTDVDNYLDNQWEEYHMPLYIGDMLPMNCMWKFVFKKQVISSEGASTYVTVDEITIPFDLVGFEPPLRIWSGSNGFYSEEAYIEIDEGGQVMDMDMYPQNSYENPVIKFYYKPINYNV